MIFVDNLLEIAKLDIFHDHFDKDGFLLVMNAYKHSK
jgi:hypothetical protein